MIYILTDKKKYDILIIDKTMEEINMAEKKKREVIEDEFIVGNSDDVIDDGIIEKIVEAVEIKENGEE